jgi:hypothetical protein
VASSSRTLTLSETTEQAIANGSRAIHRAVWQ